MRDRSRGAQRQGGFIINPFALGGGSAAGAAWNPADMSSGLILSSSNRRMTAPSDTTSRAARTLTAKSSGKWALPIKVINRSGAYVGVGIASGAVSLPAFWSTNDGALFDGDGGKFRNGVYSAYTGSVTNNDVMEALYDATAGTIRFTKNGSDCGLAYSGIGAGWRGAAYVSYSGASLEIISTRSAYAIANGYALWD